MKYFLAISLLLIARAGSAIDFKQVLRNPHAYHHQRVTITGVARVQGLSFDLYGNAADARKFAPADRAVSISQSVDGPRYDGYDNRWVKLTGIVDANRHGRFDYPCVIFLDRVEPLPLPPAGRKHVVIEGVFRNEDSKAVDMVLLDEAGEMYAEFSVLGHEINGTGIRKGTAEVRERSGKVITRYNLLLSDQDSRYFDAASHTYYYRIANGKVEGVSPKEAKGWERRSKER